MPPFPQYFGGYFNISSVIIDAHKTSAYSNKDDMDKLDSGLCYWE